METKQMCSNVADFSAWLRKQLDEQKMTVARVAKISGVHPNTIRNYLSYRCEPTFYNVLCIAKALGYDIEAIKR